MWHTQHVTHSHERRTSLGLLESSGPPSPPSSGRRRTYACCMLHVARCMLHIACCMLRVACCMLHVRFAEVAVARVRIQTMSTLPFRSPTRTRTWSNLRENVFLHTRERCPFIRPWISLLPRKDSASAPTCHLATRSLGVLKCETVAKYVFI
jgi:hypothetical protein